MTDDILRAAFIPFGEVTDVNMPMDNSSCERDRPTHRPLARLKLQADASRSSLAAKHKGFAFLQFEDRHDAADAIDNMNNAELFGRVLRVNVAKPSAGAGGHRPVWESHADTYYRDKTEGVGEEGQAAEAAA